MHIYAKLSLDGTSSIDGGVVHAPDMPSSEQLPTMHSRVTLPTLHAYMAIRAVLQGAATFIKLATSWL